MKNKFFLYTAVLGLVVSSAAAADEGFYAGLIGGANWINRSNSHSSNSHNHCGANSSNNHAFRGDNQAGYLVGFDLGYTWCNNFSGEFEFVYRHNDLRHCKKRHPKGSNFSNEDGKGRKGKHHGHGDVDGYSVMFNGRYDVCIDMCFTPYVKGGIGWGRTRLHASHHEKKSCDQWEKDQFDFKHSRSKSGFAWQVGAGLCFPVCDNTLLDVGYNFLRVQTKHETNNNSFVAALRYMF